MIFAITPGVKVCIVFPLTAFQLKYLGKEMDKCMTLVSNSLTWPLTRLKNPYDQRNKFPQELFPH